MPEVDNMDLKSLRYFIVVAQTGNIGRAASILSIHPATLGRIITSFERQLGFELFKKYSKGVVLTTKGKHLLSLGPEVLRSVERIYDIGENFTQKRSVIVGVPSSLAPFLVSDLYEDIRNGLPGSKVAFLEADSLELENRVISGHVDVALIYNPPELYSLVSDPIVEEAVLFVYPPSWNFEPPDRPMHIRDMQDLPIVLMSMGLSERRFIGRLEQQSGLRLKPIIEVASFTTINSIVNRGLACTIALAHSVSREVARGSLVTHQIGRPNLKMVLNLVTSKGVMDNTDIPVLLSRIRETIETMIRSGKWTEAELIRNKDLPEILPPSHFA